MYRSGVIYGIIPTIWQLEIREKDFRLPNSRIMVHQPSAGFQGQATDIEIHAKEILSLKKRLNKIYSKAHKKK